MQYQSTRDKNLKASSAQAILNGLAPDGGLYTMPSFDEVKFDYTTVLNMDTMSMSTKILSKLLPDFSEAEMAKLVHDGYTGKFETDHLTPTVPVGEDFILELFRGPTSAFKDVALSMLPRLMTASKEKLGVDDEIMILTATSGDTGKAAMEGFCDVPGTKIIVFYPHGGVSAVQQAQMATQAGENVCVCAVRGNFDDAQTGVKKIFNDTEMKAELEEAGYQFSSANSINIGRLVPQIVYYVYAYANLYKTGQIQQGEEINVVVPTGNFGNILAAYYAKNMGLPIKKLICASNDNKVLFDFFTTGTYDRNREFILTTSPSMDILISSNLERLIYRIAGNDPEKNKVLMEELTKDGAYHITDEMKMQLADFYGNYATEEETAETIRKIYKDCGYVIDTHTSVAATVYKKYTAETGDTTKTVIASTASPYKFTRSVMEAIDEGKYAAMGDFELIDQLSEISGVAVPNAIEEIRNAEVRHNTVADVAEMPVVVKKILGIQ